MLQGRFIALTECFDLNFRDPFISITDLENHVSVGIRCSGDVDVHCLLGRLGE